MKLLKKQLEETQEEILPWLKEAERLKADPTVSLIDSMKPLQYAYWFYWRKVNNILQKAKDEQLNR